MLFLQSHMHIRYEPEGEILQRAKILKATSTEQNGSQFNLEKVTFKKFKFEYFIHISGFAAERPPPAHTPRIYILFYHHDFFACLIFVILNEFLGCTGQGRESQRLATTTITG